MRTSSNKVHINQLVGKYMVRMVKMNQLIQSVYAGSDATSINVVIDLFSIKNSILGVDFEADGFDLCSAILDLIVHYKNYFRGLRVDANFILIDSNNHPIYNVGLFPNYNCEYMVKTTSENYQGVVSNINLLGQICEYLPGINFIHTEYEVSVVIAFLLEIFGPAVPTMIISRDPYVSMLFDLPVNLTWLYPSKYKGNDMSSIVNCATARQFAFEKMYGLNPSSYDDLLPGLSMSMIYAATKFPPRGMRPMMQYRTLCSKVNESRDIVWNLNCMEDMIPNMKERFQALDIPLQLEVYRMTAESSLSKNPAPKKYDTEALKLINNDLFAGTLQLDDLLR